MNQAELVKAIAADTLIKAETVRRVLEAQGNVVANHLASTDYGIDADVSLPGIGKIKAVTRAARTGRNPATGAEIEIPERVALKLSPSKAMNETINP